MSGQADAPVDPINSPNTFSYFTPLPFSCASRDPNDPTCTAYSGGSNGTLLGVADVPRCTNGGCAFPSNMLGRNTYRIPNNYNVNLGVYKTFKLTERMGMQFRAESYNLFNHSNYYLNYGGTDSEFGSPVTVEKRLCPG